MATSTQPSTSGARSLPTNIVLQCDTCRTIVGDTTDFVDLCSIPDGFDCIVLKAASDVDIGEEARMQGGQTKVMQGGQTKVMQGEGNDTASYLDVNVPNDSIYYDVHCSNCSACIGRMYTQMPGEQGDGGIVDSFCFDLRRVLRYQLGSSMLMVGKYNVDDGRKEGDGGDVGDHHGEGGIGEQLEERRHERDTTLPVSSNKRPRVDDSDDDMRRRIVELEARLEDMEQMLVMHDEYIAKMLSNEFAQNGNASLEHS